MADKNELIIHEELPEDAVHHDDIVLDDNEIPESVTNTETKRSVISLLSNSFYEFSTKLNTWTARFEHFQHLRNVALLRNSIT